MNILFPIRDRCKDLDRATDLPYLLFVQQANYTSEIIITMNFVIVQIENAQRFHCFKIKGMNVFNVVIGQIENFQIFQVNLTDR